MQVTVIKKDDFNQRKQPYLYMKEAYRYSHSIGDLFADDTNKQQNSKQRKTAANSK